MPLNLPSRALIASLLSAILSSQAFAASLALSKAEDAGISSERLQRIHPLIQSHIDSKDLSGAVTLVVRRGKLVHFEAQGSTDFESNQPMRTDTLSMTKPIT